MELNTCSKLKQTMLMHVWLYIAPFLIFSLSLERTPLGAIDKRFSCFSTSLLFNKYSFLGEIKMFFIIFMHDEIEWQGMNGITTVL